MVVPWSPGGDADTRARMIGARLALGLGRPVVIENRPGAGGALGAAVVARAPADGYTLLYCTVNELALAPAVMPNPGFDAVRDLAPVIHIATGPTVLVANPGLEVRTWRELKYKAGTPATAWTFASWGAARAARLLSPVRCRDHRQLAGRIRQLHPCRAGALGGAGAQGGDQDRVTCSTRRFRCSLALAYRSAGSSNFTSCCRLCRRLAKR